MRGTDKNFSLEERINKRLQRIANVLLLNASFIDNPGLLNGKMGIAIFFYHYSRYTKNKVYEEYAGELIDEIYEEINTSTPVNFENGLTGIGWGIEYLVHNGFIEANTDEVLADIDNYINQSILSCPLSPENCSDLTDYGFYYQVRLGARYIDDENPAVKRIIEHLTLLTDYNERVFVKNEFPNFDFRSLTVDTINSFLRFLLKMYRIGLSQGKVEKVLYYMSKYVETCLSGSCENLDQSLLKVLVANVINSVPDNLLQETYRSMLEKKNRTLSIAISTEDTVVDNFIRNTWQNLVYEPYLRDSRTFLNDSAKCFSVIVIEEFWERLLDNLSAKNLGLKGFAGQGLGILNFAESMQNHYEEYSCTNQNA